LFSFDMAQVTRPEDTETEADPTPRLISVPDGATYRLPDADDPAEKYLFQANEIDRIFSKQQIAGLFPGFSGDNPPIGGPFDVDVPRLQRLFDMDLLDRLVDHGVDPSRLTVSNWQFLGDVTNAALPGSERVHGAIAGRAASEGGRVTLTGVERTTPGLRRLAEHLGRVWQARVIIAVVAGTGAFSGQNEVKLAYDHMILPVLGLRHVVAKLPDGDTLHAGPLGPGEALHLPAGTSVSTTAVNELFVHLELRIERPLPLSLLPMIVNLPTAQQITWPGDGSSLQDSLVAQWCAALPTRPGTRFSSVVGPNTAGNYSAGWVRPTFTGGWCLLVTDNQDSSPIMAVAAGVCLGLPQSILPVLAHALSGPPKRVSEVLASSPQAERLVDLLIVSGLMEFLPTRDADDSWDTADIELETDHAL
jgi:hypothetical protein